MGTLNGKSKEPQPALDSAIVRNLRHKEELELGGLQLLESAFPTEPDPAHHLSPACRPLEPVCAL